MLEATDRRFWGGKSRQTWVLFCAVEGEMVARFARFALTARVGPRTASDIEPTLGQAAWDGRTRPKPVVVVTTG
jgi:hypothetical protein